MSAWLATATWVGLVVAYAALANVWNGRDPGWYAALPRPSVQPPDSVFALVWRSVPGAGLTLAPYAVWLTVATTLAVQYARMPGAGTRPAGAAPAN